MGGLSMGLDSLIPTAPKVRDWDLHWMRHATLNAEMSTCLTRQTGAVIVNAKRLISAGFNGNVPGARHCNDGGCLRCGMRKGFTRSDAPDSEKIPSGQSLDTCVCVHAEANAVAQCARLHGGASGATIYTTHRPCLDCVKLIAVSGIVQVVFLEDYPASYDAPPTIRMRRLT